MKDRPHLDHQWLTQQITLHKTARKVAQVHNLSERAVQRQAKKMKETMLHPVSQSILEMERPLTEFSIMQELVISGNGVVASDLHIPVIDLNVMVQIVEEAVKHNATDYLAVVGDLFNFDSLSDYMPKQSDAGLPGELEFAQELLVKLLEVFDVIYITKGNHDIRLARSLGYKLAFEHTIKMCFPDITPEQRDRIIVTGNDYLIIDSSNGKWHCAHTNAYSKIPLAVPRELCDVLQMHVAGAHRHHHAIGKSKSGNHYAVELGGAFDRSRTTYLRNWTTTFPVWVPGFMILTDGVPYLPMLAPVPNN